MIWAGDLTKQSEAGKENKKKAKGWGGSETEGALCISFQKIAHNYNYLPYFIAQDKSDVAPNPTGAALVIRKYSTPWRAEET
jgi:hypothetical protein